MHARLHAHCTALHIIFSSLVPVSLNSHLNFVFLVPLTRSSQSNMVLLMLLPLQGSAPQKVPKAHLQIAVKLSSFSPLTTHEIQAPLILLSITFFSFLVCYPSYPATFHVTSSSLSQSVQ